jgi:16S rRNA (adenine1518-N6/adenine1519-N6)-dimethyltransferase
LTEHPTHHRARKRFGQNFLHDQQVISRIVKAIVPSAGQSLVEIGPGQGALTGPILATGASLTAIEIDRDLAARLRQEFTDNPAFTLVEMDVLDFDFASLVATPASLRILGNLPYNISTPLLFHLLQYRELIHDMVFMLQLEVVERLAAAPGSDHYGRLSVMAQYHCRVELLFKVPPGAFVPRPKVDSAIVRLVPHRPLPHPVHDYACFEQVVRAAFGQRRKTLRNTLKSFVTSSQWETLGIDSGLRAETLGVGDYARIANLLTEAGKS